MDKQFGNVNRSKLQSALNNVAGESGLNTAKLSEALNSGKVENVLNSLNPTQASKLKNLLNDQEALNRILSSPQAAKILKELTK